MQAGLETNVMTHLQIYNSLVEGKVYLGKLLGEAEWGSSLEGLEYLRNFPTVMRRNRNNTNNTAQNGPEGRRLEARQKSTRRLLQ